MADVVVATANKVQQWSKRLLYEYVRDMQLRELIGKTPGAPIQMVEELNQLPGQDVTVSLLTKLSGDGVTGDNTLEGNEVVLGNYAHKITVDQVRQGVRVGHMEQKKTHIELLTEARPMLKDWAMAKLRDEILAAMLVPNVDGQTRYASCTAAQRNAWLTANADRVLFGVLKSNASSLVMSTALATVTTSTDALTYAVASLAKRIAKTASPAIRPVKVDGGGEWYVGLAGSRGFRDLKNSLVSVHEYAAVRGSENPLFKDGDIMWDGMIWKEIPEIATLGAVGDTSCVVDPAFLLGAQAIGIGVGERLHAIDNERDFGNLKAVGVAEIRAVDKLIFNDVQLGMVNIFHDGTVDA
jgi:N4-gp56 family major capsid protein